MTAPFETKDFEVVRRWPFYRVVWKRLGLARPAFTRRGAERLCRRFQRQYDSDRVIR